MLERPKPTRGTRRTRILTVIGMTAGVLLAGALVFAGHIALNDDPTHGIAGDIVFAVAITMPVFVVAGIAIGNQRSS